MSVQNPIIFYDGVCGLCNHVVQFTLKRDKKGMFRYAALQSAFAEEILPPYGGKPKDLNTLYVLVGHPESKAQLLHKSTAALFVLRNLGGFWRLLSLGRILPTFLRDFMYDMVARSRYSIFGKQDSCMLPKPEWSDRFLDQEG
ncbi:MAG: DCC1-like thiol-disulfide oxidoreductase family protein [Myxococcota bacterium]|nr:DCC1-like thiol-disulfide oxidoreductase family protein [Myxococcota bacterium]